jgi:CheY-like chemotaxis protein
VLVADNNAASRELLRTVLEEDGHAVWEALDGVDAVERAREIVPDPILLDLRMPRRDEFSVVREVRSSPGLKATAIITLTASAMNGGRELAPAEGIDGYLTKPIGLRALRDELKVYCG